MGTSCFVWRSFPIERNRTDCVQAILDQPTDLQSAINYQWSWKSYHSLQKRGERRCKYKYSLFECLDKDYDVWRVWNGIVAITKPSKLRAWPLDAKNLACYAQRRRVLNQRIKRWIPWFNSIQLVAKGHVWKHELRSVTRTGLKGIPLPGNCRVSERTPLKCLLWTIL